MDQGVLAFVEYSSPESSIGNGDDQKWDGYPPETAGMTEGERDPCHRHADLMFTLKVLHCSQLNFSLHMKGE